MIHPMKQVKPKIRRTTRGRKPNPKFKPMQVPAAEILILLWLSVVSVSIIVSGQLANKFYQRHESANMRTLVKNNHDPSWRFRLPAITICHSNIATLNRVATLIDKRNISMPFGTTVADFHDSLKYISIALFPTNRFAKELAILERVLTINRLPLSELFELISPSCSDFTVMCQFEGKEQNCNDLISRSVTPAGMCCSFNYAHLPDQNRWNTTIHDKYSINFGPRFMLSLLMRSSGPTDRVSSMMFGDGVKVIIHERNTYPGPSSLEFVAATGLETVARLYGRRLIASTDVLSLPPTDRDCKKSRSPSDVYRADNCYVKCQESAFLRLCGCLPFFSSKIEFGQSICNISHVSCLSRVRTKAFKLTLRDPSCDCLPDCESTMFSLVTTSLPFNAARFNPSKFYKKAMSVPNTTTIHITFSGQSGMRLKRELVLSWINLVSSLGGVFCLFLGCSFISIMEIIYFFSICVVLGFKKRLLGTRT